MEKEIEILSYKKLDLRGGVLIDGFPSVGFVETIIANYYIRYLNLDCIAYIDSKYFPPTSMVYAGKPKFPARIYANEEKKISVFVAEFIPHPSLARLIGKTICEWANHQGISKIISIEGIPVEEEVDPEIYAVGSTDNSRKLLEQFDIKQMEEGVVIGIPAVILNYCRWLNIDAFIFLVKVHPKFPEFRAAAKIIEFLNNMLPNIKVDVKPLYQEAEIIEQKLKSMNEKTKTVVRPPSEIFYR